MLFGDDGITIKQLSYLLVSQGFKKCELWDAVDYSMAHHHSKEYRLHVVNGIILKNLIKIGLSTKSATRWVCLNGPRKLDKQSLEILGKPVWTGSMAELTLQTDLFDTKIHDCVIYGLFRNKIALLTDDKISDRVGDRKI